ncbi:Uncharacterised protein [Starkeya nomas]|uniref:Terminase large subunit gp17-like C-terminal domain-containing protein n=1 Tax=Starkeya nomas TaxID=2666134 RepID=A0A5S9NZB7_9HYPH|nr:hypothetical protein [Starkeya nomas]CAA0096193.1 Uncharacterised protein [Starkeya nomas]
MTDLGILNAWEPPGPIAEAFALDFHSLFKGIGGPVGGGKTTTCIFSSQAFSASMPTCLDGVVRSKGVVVRDSFRTLEKTTLASWFTWFPKDHPSWTYTGGNDRPAVHTLRFRLPGDRMLESVTEFVGIGDKRVEDILRGWEGSWAWMNEADLMVRDVLDYLTQRIRRYPSKRLLPPGIDPPGQVMADFNMPDIDNWLHGSEQHGRAGLVELKPPGWAFYRQPGGLDRGAENLKNLPRDYYQRMMEGKPDWWKRRFIDNLWGYSRFGTPVYPEFNDALHVAPRKLDPLPGIPIGIGTDAGMTPAAVIAQQMPNGQIRVLDELVPGHNCGPARFSEMLVALLMERYRGFDIRLAVGDPSAQFGADTEAGELAWLDIVSKALGRPVLPCFTNEPSLRFEGVRLRLTTLIDGQTPGLIVSPHCKKLVQGFAYGYRFENQRKDPNAPFKEKAEKNDFSHPHDALQYLVLELVGRMPLYAQAARAGRPGSFGPAAAPAGSRPGDFDVFAI